MYPRTADIHNGIPGWRSRVFAAIRLLSQLPRISSCIPSNSATAVVFISLEIHVDLTAVYALTGILNHGFRNIKPVGVGNHYHTKQPRTITPTKGMLSVNTIVTARHLSVLHGSCHNTPSKAQQQQLPYRDHQSLESASASSCSSNFFEAKRGYHKNKGKYQISLNSGREDPSTGNVFPGAALISPTARILDAGCNIGRKALS